MLATERAAPLRAVSCDPEPSADDVDPRDPPDLKDPLVATEVDRRLVALARARGPTRAALAEIAWWLVRRSAWERLGYARLSDYAGERLGISSRSVRDLANVGSRLDYLPALRAALVNGQLGWTKVRLVARVADRSDEQKWIAMARICTAAALSKEVRRVDTGSVEAGAAEQWSLTGAFEIPCTQDVRLAWGCARAATTRVAGRQIHVSESAEMIAAEVLSSIALDPQALDEMEREQREEADDARADAAHEARAGVADDARAEDWMLRPERFPQTPVLARTDDHDDSDDDDHEDRGDPWPPLPDELARLVEDVENADAFELDRMMRAAVRYEQRLDARMGALLALIRRGRLNRVVGYSTIEAYARERLGIDPSKVRALLRVERAARESPALGLVYRSARISALQALTLAPLFAGGGVDDSIDRWVSWSRRVTLRRLRDDVDAALQLREVDPATWLLTAGLPADARDDGARAVVASTMRKRGIGAQPNAPRETDSVRFFGSTECVRLFKAVLCTVRRRVERATGCLPTPGEGLLIMIECALDAWGEIRGVPRMRAVFERDGWRCTVPGCSSRQNLHAHHVRFRSAGGGDEAANLVTLCAFHHLRGVHAGTVRCSGTAPDKLRFELGLRGAKAPLAVYESGDRLVAVAATAAAAG